MPMPTMLLIMHSPRTSLVARASLFCAALAVLLTLSFADGAKAENSDNLAKLEEKARRDSADLFKDALEDSTIISRGRIGQNSLYLAVKTPSNIGWGFSVYRFETAEKAIIFHEKYMEEPAMTKDVSAVPLGDRARVWSRDSGGPAALLCLQQGSTVIIFGGDERDLVLRKAELISAFLRQNAALKQLDTLIQNHNSARTAATRPAN